MEYYDVIIIGGGPAGLTTALTLASAEGKFPFVEGKRYLVIYDQYSDLDKALLNNVPGIEKGTYGRDLLKKIRDQVSEYGSVDLVQDRVVKAEGEKGDFRVYTESGKGFRSDILVIATGFHRFDIEGLDINVVPHTRSPRPNKIMIENNDNLVRDGLYVAGLVAGEPTMFVSAAGSGAKVACDILSLWAGKTVVVHDVPEGE
ncbi:MAG TPA: NAD(P)/FAD-dependent oxidoreductase [Persephonella sp.]|uniref:FAD-dependent pyridine nucleotide-disulphide oxidoreductase n=1 Tax=Persephonella marina (strain DSM 14350 / EX-H1) TaxID=123214 RepID=C0QSL8_PERMH|nr:MULTISPECIES: NAD(P)/FAD-dependent oxidoreductase [Persephonella]ACO04045.1 FAD-dependent pyridine nucleotide-disulphide oxidoreductase [Persephonella marina EX-H1]HCB69411.1 NAD(P)/FAD-dependent oxidoreductase [Persephonella sp.]